MRSYKGLGEDAPVLNAIVEHTFPHVFRITSSLMQLDVNNDTGEILRVCTRIFDELIGVRLHGFIHGHCDVYRLRTDYLCTFMRTLASHHGWSCGLRSFCVTYLRMCSPLTMMREEGTYSCTVILFDLVQDLFSLDGPGGVRSGGQLRCGISFLPRWRTSNSRRSTRHSLFILKTPTQGPSSWQSFSTHRSSSYLLRNYDIIIDCSMDLGVAPS